MFNELASLLNQAALSGLHLMIRPAEGGRLSVTVSAEKAFGDVKNESLRAALSQGLTLEGTVTELEEGFFTHFDSFSNSFANAVLSANTSEVTNELNAQTTSKEVTDSVTDDSKEGGNAPVELSDSDDNSAL